MGGSGRVGKVNHRTGGNMDKEKIFTLTECEAIIAVSEAIASERVHPEAVDFSCKRRS